jgi:hypothetical protein
MEFKAKFYLEQKQKADVAPIGQTYLLGERTFRTFADLKTAIQKAYGYTYPATHSLVVQIFYTSPVAFPNGAKIEHVTLSETNQAASMTLLEGYVTSFELPDLKTILEE